MANDKRPSTNDDGKKNFFVALARYSQLAFVLPACTVVGWLIGVALDHWLHKNWIYLVGPDRRHRRRVCRAGAHGHVVGIEAVKS